MESNIRVEIFLRLNGRLPETEQDVLSKEDLVRYTDMVMRKEKCPRGRTYPIDGCFQYAMDFSKVMKPNEFFKLYANLRLRLRTVPIDYKNFGNTTFQDIYTELDEASKAGLKDNEMQELPYFKKFNELKLDTVLERLAK